MENLGAPAVREGRLPRRPPWPGPPPLLPPGRLKLAVRPPLAILIIVSSFVTLVFVHHRHVATDVPGDLAEVPDPQAETVEFPPDAPRPPVLKVRVWDFIKGLGLSQI